MKNWQTLFCCALALLCSCQSAKSAGETDAVPSGVVVDLGEISHYIKITPEYSNAVLKAVLPCFSDAAKKLGLPVPDPITPADLAGIHILPFREMTVSIMLKDGWAFEYMFGYVNLIANGRGYSALQDPGEIPRYYGQVKMTKAEAIQFARDSLKKLGINLEDVFADQEPRVTLPVKIGTNTVPHYEVEWIDPRSDFHSVDIHINANAKQIERLSLFNKHLARSRLPIVVIPVPDPDWPSVNPEYAKQLIPLMFTAIGKYAKKLSLPIPVPLTANNAARVEVHDNEGWPHAEVTLTNGWRFVYRHCMVNGFYAPDNFFDSVDRKIHIHDFEGQWNLTTNQAIEVVRQAIAKLDYPTNHIHIDDAQSFIHAAAVAKDHIPRLYFEWYYETDDDLQSRLKAEVNTDNGKLESLDYDDKAYWNCRPPIDVPISLPPALGGATGK